MSTTTRPKNKRIPTTPDRLLDLDIPLPLRFDAQTADCWVPGEYDLQWAYERYLFDTYAGMTIMREHRIAPGLRPDFTVRYLEDGATVLVVIELKWLAGDAAIRQLRGYLAAAEGMAEQVYGVLVAVGFYLSCKPRDIQLVQVRPHFPGMDL